MKTFLRPFFSLLAVAAALMAKAQTDTLFIYSPNERQGLHAAVLE